MPIQAKVPRLGGILVAGWVSIDGVARLIREKFGVPMGFRWILFVSQGNRRPSALRLILSLSFSFRFGPDLIEDFDWLGTAFHEEICPCMWVVFPLTFNNCTTER
ncbi:hypothetical protein OPV22_022800 [Ensete ventricosum]|uniref:Uncharacterized protein n=1 Tax=Ensete ventricosum TaxID=4639 RepID=A0AAV8QP99_ENSVE|nr:hypothetical protein OPV22_022800 [Ensete ventricosum]